MDENYIKYREFENLYELADFTKVELAVQLPRIQKMVDKMESRYRLVFKLLYEWKMNIYDAGKIMKIKRQTCQKNVFK